MKRVDAEQLSFIAGLGTWLVVGIPLLLELATRGAPALSDGRYLGALGAYLGFGVMFALIISGRLEPPSPRGQVAVLALQSLLAAAALLLTPRFGIQAVLFIITASHAAHVLPLRHGVYWVLGQTGVIAAAGAIAFDNPAWIAVQTLAYLGFQLFALFSTQTAVNEAKAKAQLAQLNAELRATQALLIESSRLAERVQISRELHDLIGHHLTALALNLEVAHHLSEGAAKDHVAKAQALAKLLLSDVREVVSTLRDHSTFDLAQAIRTLVADVPRPAIHLTLGELGLDDPARAHALLRCTQEIVTNAVRHARAENLWLSFERRGDAIVIHAHDDGRGAKAVRIGHGLKGMRERLEQFGGRLSFASAPGRGFAIDGLLPL